MYCSLSHEAVRAAPSADPEGQGVRTPSGKSQIEWVSIGNKQLDTPWKNLDPLEKIGPIWSMNTIDFFEIDHLTSVKSAED